MSMHDLVKGGHRRNTATPSTFACTTPPVVFKNTRIVAVTHPTVHSGNPEKDGWFLSDFYAFNYLYHGLGASQVWLSAAEPEKLIAAYDVYLHGNPYQDRKVVLSRELLDQKKLTPVTYVKPTAMIERFLKEVKKAAAQAQREDAPLLLLVFCHGLSNFHFLLDDGNPNKGLGILRLKSVIDIRVRVTLVTTACYSGGWTVSEDLNSTVMAAASVKTMSNAWCCSASTYRACGSVFASTLIETLCSTTSELVHDEDQQQPSSSSPSALEPLQPENPTEEQTKTYNEFCRSILEVCGDRIHRLWDEQKFSFSAQHDQWDSSWMGRTGIPLEYYARRWSELVTYPYTGTAELRALKDPSPLNMSFSEENQDKPFAGRFGFGSSGDPIDAMTASIRHRRVSEMARLFLLTCPGDWSSGQEVKLASLLRDCVEGKEISEEEWGLDIVATIQFRWELALIADRLVDMLGLPPPGGQPCIMWNRHTWINSIKSKIPDWDERESVIYSKLYSRGFFVHGTQRQGPPFLRFVKYVISALIEADTSDTKTNERIDAVVAFMDRAKEFNRQRVLEQPTVRSRSQAWLKSLGRRMRDSVQPKKPPQQPDGQVGLARRRHSISASSDRLLPPLDLGSPLRRSASTGALSKQAWV